MAKQNFSNSEIRTFFKSLNRPVAWFINRSGNIEFCELNKQGVPVYHGKVWFKLVRTTSASGEVLTRFWKGVKNSSHWQLFRNSRTGKHADFANVRYAAWAMKQYLTSHNDRDIYDTYAENRWPTTDQLRGFCERASGRINYYIS